MPNGAGKVHACACRSASLKIYARPNLHQRWYVRVKGMPVLAQNRLAVPQSARSAGGNLAMQVVVALSVRQLPI